MSDTTTTEKKPVTKRVKNMDRMRAMGFTVNHSFDSRTKELLSVEIRHMTFRTGGIGGSEYYLKFDTLTEAEAWFDGYCHAMKILTPKPNLED